MQGKNADLHLISPTFLLFLKQYLDFLHIVKNNHPDTSGLKSLQKQTNNSEVRSEKHHLVLSFFADTTWLYIESNDYTHTHTHTYIPYIHAYFSDLLTY